MSSLTTTACPFRLLPMPKNKAGRATTSELTKRIVACTLKRPFLRLKFVVKLAPLFGCCIRAEASKVAEGRALVGMEQSLFGCGNSYVQRPPFSITTEMLGTLKPTKVLVMTDKITAYMPEECFTFNQNVDKSKLYDPTYLILKRIQASLVMLQDNGQDISEGFTVPHNIIIEMLAGAEANLEQAITLVEKAAGVTRL